MRFPVVLKGDEEAGRSEPGKLYYVVAGNGLFQVRDTGIYRAVTRVETGVPGLPDEEERIDFDLPRLPSVLLEEVLAFFDQVNREHGAEAIVVLFYSAERREYAIRVPPQTITGYRASYDGRFVADLRLEYENVERPEGFLRFGSIHSHAHLGAYASIVDCADERYDDGLHVVFGNFGSRRLSCEAAFVANGARFPVAADVVLEPASVPERGAKPSWMDRVVRVERSYGSLSAGVWTGAGYVVPISSARESKNERTDG